MKISQTEVNDIMSELPDDLLIALVNIYKIYKTVEIETVALRGVSLSLFEGEIIGIIGPSGSGKSTLVNIMAGLIKPTAGMIYWAPFKADISRMSDNLVSHTRNQFIGTFSQISEANLLPHLSVVENVMLQGEIGHISRSQLKKRAIELLDRVGLKSRRNSKPMLLSTGEKQRVALAAALINQPKIILADEPTGSVDYGTGEELLELIHEINGNHGTAFLIVTHSQQVVPHTHRVIEIRDGIIAGQHKDIIISNLEQSRIIIADNQGRILLPEELLNGLGAQTNHFKAFLDDGKIILEPMRAQFLRKKILDQLEHQKEKSCPVCSTLNSYKNITCSNCGSLLRKANRLTERG
ncbi:MAG: ABC transporter ATP-binding protein [Candidatus Hodarchaeota archaeon]